MTSIKHIESAQNPLIKKMVVLTTKARERKKTELFVIEGLREIKLALKGGYILQTVLFEPSIVSPAAVDELLKTFNSKPERITITDHIYKKLAYRQSTEGILAIVHTKKHLLQNLILPTKNPLILVAEAPEKPGNIGALLRTADAANVDAVLIANPKSDIYNPNIIRSSVGCAFTTQIATGTTTEIIQYLKEHKINMFCAALTSSTNYATLNYTQACAIVVGTEATGLSDQWLNKSDQNIIIPMQGQIDSLNVSVSAAILIFEARRQRDS